MTDKLGRTIQFPKGMPGFEHLTKFILLEEESKVFYYLQSLEDEQIYFTVMDPYTLVPDYAPNVHEYYFEQTGAGKMEDYAIYVVATIRSTLDESTVNLQGPILINTESKCAIQAIVEEKQYKTRHNIKDLLREKGGKVC
ncbi:MAG: flagellar assembly protein FliW [Cellulosilyticaceae bacterium]